MIMLDRLENIFHNTHSVILENMPKYTVPSPPLTQHFALNEKLVLSSGKGKG